MIKVIILLLVVLDITLTHYQFFLDRKKGVLDIRQELNIIPRLIMGKNPNPKNYLVGSFTSIFIILLLISVINEIEFIYILIGIFGIVDYVHISHIQQIYKPNWNNKKYWKFLRQVRKLRW